MSGRRIYSTADGTYVLEGDVRAERLAYGIADDVPADLVIDEGDAPEDKAVKASSDKAVRKPADK